MGMDVVAKKPGNAEDEAKSAEIDRNRQKPPLLGEGGDSEERDAEREARFGHVELIVPEVELVVISLKVLRRLLDFELLGIVLLDPGGVLAKLAVEHGARVARETGRRVALHRDLIDHSLCEMLLHAL